MSSAKKFITNNGFLYTAGIAFFLLLWFLISLSQGTGNLVFPTPAETFAEVLTLLGQSYIYTSIGQSLLKTFIGFLVSFGLALLLGSLNGQLKFLQTFFKPTLAVLKSAPTAAFVFFFIVYFGSSNAPIYVVVLLAFPILYESVVAGFNAIPEQMLWASRIDAASKTRILFKIKLPLALPYIILGLVSSFALSLKTEIMAEIVTGSTAEGLGSAIRYFRNDDPSNLTPVFAIALIAIVIILVFDGVAAIFKKRLETR